MASNQEILDAARKELKGYDPELSVFSALCDAFEVSMNCSEETLEAIRLTQESVVMPAIEGWSWYDVYKKYRPEDAKRLKEYADLWYKKEG